MRIFQSFLTLLSLFACVSFPTAAAEPGQPAATEASSPVAEDLPDHSIRFVSVHHTSAERLADLLRHVDTGPSSQRRPRVVADERTNTLILTGADSDLELMEKVIARLDAKLPQVLIPALYVEISLSEELPTGMDWVAKHLLKDQNPIPYQGEGSYGLGFSTLRDIPVEVIRDAVVKASGAKILASPIVSTSMNEEETIRIGERRAIQTTTATTIGGKDPSSLDYEDIGLTLTVRPRSDGKEKMILDVTQSMKQMNETTIVDGKLIPIITSRASTLSVSVPSGGTLVLGGLAQVDPENGSKTETLMFLYPTLQENP